MVWENIKRDEIQPYNRKFRLDTTPCHSQTSSKRKQENIVFEKYIVQD